MRKRVFWKILTMALVLGMTLALVACGNDNGDEGGNAFIGPELTLSGQVYTVEMLETAPWIRFTRFTDDLAITTWPEGIGTGSVTGGNLSFTAGIPPASALEEWYIDDEWVDDQGRPIYSISPADTMMVWLELEVPGGGLWRGHGTINQAGTTSTEEGVDFIYVNQDATWTGRRFTETDTWTGRRFTETDTWTDDDGTFTETWTENAFNINLRQGWNAIHFRDSVTTTATSFTGTRTTSAGNPGNFRWIMEMWNDYSAGIEALGVEVERPGSARGSMFRVR